ncbi:MAG: CARDB domain-containing protein [Eubacterium sp.]
MKKLITIILAFVICFGFTLTAYAEEKETTQDASSPRLMVTDFKVDGGSLKPNKKSTLTVTLKNFSRTKYIKNIKLSVAEESGDIKPVGTGTKYVDRIGAGSTYTWTIELTASATAQIGEHAVTVSSEYEDKYYGSYSGSDVIRINVKQTVGLDYSGVQLPVKVYPDDTTTMEIAILNTGKSNIRNCKIDFDIKGLENGGSTYVGEIPAGEQSSASANLRVGKELGDTEGIVTITYEDEFGKSYTKKQKVSTKIVEKPVEPETEEEEQSKYPLWWAFLLGGTVLGGGVGCAIPITVYNNKQRKEDEMRL